MPLSEHIGATDLRAKEWEEGYELVAREAAASKKAS